MFLFESKSGKKLALRPEGTAGVVRAYLEHGMQQLPQPVELYYIEPFFRYSRPQKGRYRQFHQFGFEVIGEHDPALDAQVIYLSHKINQDLGGCGSLNLTPQHDRFFGRPSKIQRRFGQFLHRERTEPLRGLSKTYAPKPIAITRLQGGRLSNPGLHGAQI